MLHTFFDKIELKPCKYVLVFNHYLIDFSFVNQIGQLCETLSLIIQSTSTAARQDKWHHRDRKNPTYLSIRSYDI